jgi:hypothetical protein
MLAGMLTSGQLLLVWYVLNMMTAASWSACAAAPVPCLTDLVSRTMSTNVASVLVRHLCCCVKVQGVEAGRRGQGMGHWAWLTAPSGAVEVAEGQGSEEGRGQLGTGTLPAVMVRGHVHA